MKKFGAKIINPHFEKQKQRVSWLSVLISPLVRIYTHHCRRHGATVDGGKGCANGSFDPDFRALEGPIFLAQKYERRDPHFPF
ncbi:hypothetical protein ES288_A02G203400v1 [Gossypium darwinii]|uniref:Uncharacterized protein n=1 Tax=Gossypium darwinii TaxID=34276 RepID=A0A5D2HI38_GOSDA|nr:hypothetical protein ES288_A02G203400v1 [Gossypium darwinii]